MRRAAALAAFRRLAACQGPSFSTLARSIAQPVGREYLVVNATKASLTVPTRGFAAEPAPAPGASKGYVKQVYLYLSACQVIGSLGRQSCLSSLNDDHQAIWMAQNLSKS